MIGIRDLFRKRADSELAVRLRTYPPFSDVPVAAPEDLTDEQAKANLDNFVARRDERLVILSDLLSAFDIDLEAGFEAADHKPFLDQIDNWVVEHWRTVPATPEQLRQAYWERSGRAGVDIVYSMLRDVGLLLGEMIIRRREGTFWGLDARLRNSDDGDGFHRPVVLGLANPAHKQPVSIENDEGTFVTFAYVAKAAEPRRHGLTRYCRGAIERYPLATDCEAGES